jgi:E3 ubiquitin-protein ligase HUWE1
LLSNPISVDQKYPAIPKWLAAHLLVTEALFTLADEPRAITLPKEDEPIVVENISTGPSHSEAQAIVFDFCLQLLVIPDLPNDELLSTLRLFVLLTRDHKMAADFVKRDGLSMLFGRIKTSAVAGSSSYIATILRHIVEDNNTIQHVMQQAVKRYFAQPRTRVVDVVTYVRNCSAMALRDPQIFIQVTQSLCQLAQPFSNPQVSLKVEASSSDNKLPQKTDSVVADMQIDVPSPTANSSGSSESLEAIVHFLISELMRTAKAINETSTVDISSPGTFKSREAENVTKEEPRPAMTTEEAAGTNAHDHYHYACFLMQCLTELLFSYDPCKLAFLSYSPKKRTQTPAKETVNKQRAATLNFLLSDLISFGTINPQPSSDTRNRITLCNWAMSVLVALCVDSSSTHELRDVSPELVSVRKFVLEAVSRAIKDLSPSDMVERHYGRLLALADLCHRLLTVRFNTASRKQQDESPTHIAKVMLEKNFVATLTTALADVDLNYPNVRGLVASILRPLEYL